MTSDETIDRAAEIIAGCVDHYIGVEPDQPQYAAQALAAAGLLPDTSGERTTVFRAYSPSSGRGTVPVTSRQRAEATADTHNRLYSDYPDRPGRPDWIVQAGTVEWETP